MAIVGLLIMGASCHPTKFTGRTLRTLLASVTRSGAILKNQKIPLEMSFFRFVVPPPGKDEQAGCSFRELASL